MQAEFVDKGTDKQSNRQTDRYKTGQQKVIIATINTGVNMVAVKTLIVSLIFMLSNKEGSSVAAKHTLFYRV